MREILGKAKSIRELLKGVKYSIIILPNNKTAG